MPVQACLRQERGAAREDGRSNRVRGRRIEAGLLTAAAQQQRAAGAARGRERDVRDRVWAVGFCRP